MSAPLPAPPGLKHVAVKLTAAKLTGGARIAIPAVNEMQQGELNLTAHEATLVIAYTLRCSCPRCRPRNRRADS